MQKRTRRKNALLLALTLVWDAYLVLFVVGVALAAVLLGTRSEPVIPTPTQLVGIVVAQLLMMLLGLGLMITYVVDVQRNPAIGAATDQRTIWTLLLIFAGPVAMPWYWFCHVRGRARRTPTPSARGGTP